jgi:hypothetical protein
MNAFKKKLKDKTSHFQHKVDFLGYYHYRNGYGKEGEEVGLHEAPVPPWPFQFYLVQEWPQIEPRFHGPWGPI